MEGAIKTPPAGGSPLGLFIRLSSDGRRGTILAILRGLMEFMVHKTIFSHWTESPC